MRFSILACFVIGCGSAAEPPVVGTQQDTGVVVVAETSEEETAKSVSAVSFHDVYTKILSGTCANGYCHGGGYAGGWSVKDEDATYAHLVGPKSTMCAGLLRVAPGEPEKSALYLKVKGGFGETCDGKRMPSAEGLPTEQVEMLRAWIAAGAPK
jgi:predicted CxxxxCH...CXXCH cytochrome family protein